MSNWKFLNEHRFQHSGYPQTDESWGFNGVFQFTIPGEARLIRCVASDGMGWKHVSVSFPHSKRSCPSWDLMCVVKDLFWEKTDVVIQYHPSDSDYINNHPGCLHLWQPTEAPIPVPPRILVGHPGMTIRDLKDLTDAELLAIRKSRTL